MTGIIINNLNEILGLGVALFAGFNLGVLKQKYLPKVVLAPWKWFRKTV